MPDTNQIENDEGACEPGAENGVPDRAVASLLELLGKRYMLTVLHLFAREPGPWRFNELETKLGISPTTLSARLAELTAVGFLDRAAFDERPPRVEYTATQRVEGLKPAFTALYRWSEEHGLAQEPAEAPSTGGTN